MVKTLELIILCSPNAEEALSLLSLPLPPQRQTIETAADRFLAYNIGGGSGWIIIRSGAMGAYIKNKKADGQWINAFWTPEEQDKIVDVTGLYGIVMIGNGYYGHSRGRKQLFGWPCCRSSLDWGHC